MINVEKIDIKKKIQMHDFFIKENKIWFTVNGCNKLFTYNIERKMLCSFGKFPEEKLNKPNLFIAIEEYRDKLIFIPFMSDKVHIYDTKKNKFESIQLSRDEKIACKYCSSFRDGDFLYLLPISCKNILKINLTNYEQEYLWNIEEFLMINKKNITNIFFNNDSCKYGNNFVSYISETKILIIFDILKQQINIKELASKYNNIISICNDNDIIFCIEHITGNIICWNIKTNKISYIKISYKNIAKESLNQILDIRHYGFVHSIFRNNSIYVCPDLGNICIKIDLETKSAYTVIENYQKQNLDNKYLNSKIHLVGQKLYFFYGIESTFITIDEDGMIKKDKILLNEEELALLRKEMLEEAIMEEDIRICDIKLLIEKNLKQEEEYNLEKVGYKIFKQIKGDY